MASTSAELIVAKAALTGALFRADPQSCSRDEIESTLALLNTTTAECSPSNVQKCKQWALTNLIPSSMRIAPFCKYLVALVNSYGKSPAKDLTESEKKRGRETSVKRKRLHALYLLNDILYHVKFRNQDDNFAPKLEQALPALVRSASSFTNCPKHTQKIQDLISLWEEKGYFSEAVIKQLRVAVEEGPASSTSVPDTAKPAATTTSSAPKPVKAAPFIMPAMHGDPSIPWYDLPAGNWMPVLEPNSTRPMNPDMIKPLVLSAGPAEKSLVEAVKKLLVDVDHIFAKDAANLDGPTPEIGQMGEVIETDEITGEVIGGETYYGWSRNFCEKMKKRNQRGASGTESRSRTRERTRSSRSRSRSYSRSRSRDSSRGSDARPAFKRQRLSESPERRHRNRSRSRSHDRSMSRSRSRSRSRDRSRRDRGYDSRSPSRSRSRGRYRSRSRSRSRSTSRPGFRQRNPKYGSRGRSRSRSPPGLRGGQHEPPYHAPPPLTSFPTGMPPRPPQHPGVFIPPPPPNQQSAGNFHPVPPPIGFPVPVPPLPGQPPHQFPGFPVPPPPPQNYQGGQWPPPPPGPPHQYPQHPQHPTPPPQITTPSPPPNFFPPGGPMGVSPHLPPFIATPPGGAWPPPPPPNQPSHHAQHQQHQPHYHQPQQQHHQGRDYQGYSQHQPRDYQQRDYQQHQQGREGEYGGNGSGYRGGRRGGGSGRGDYGHGRGGNGGQRGGAPWGGGWAQ